MAFLCAITGDVVEASRVRPGESRGKSGPNTTERTLIVPGVTDWYPAFWVEDLTLSLESGYILPDEVRSMIELVLQNQNGSQPQFLPTGAEIAAFTIPDHISFDGQAIYFPGTCAAELQGGEPWGSLSELDDNFWIIMMCCWYVQQTNDIAFLKSEINNMPVIGRLVHAFEVPPCDPSTHIVRVTKERRAVNWGFVDSTAPTGQLLMCSLLKLRACRSMVCLYDFLDEAEQADQYRQIAASLLKYLPKVFGTESGWLLAATGQCRQHDVWATVYAIYEEALKGEVRQRALEAVLKAYCEGTAACRGNIRHILTTDNWSEDSAWEVIMKPQDDYDGDATYTIFNHYQNGAYWGTPVGWFLYALAEIDRGACAQFVAEYVDELREGDYRKSGRRGSPLECFHPGTDHWQNPGYMTSVTCPLAALQRLGYGNSDVNRKAQKIGRKFDGGTINLQRERRYAGK